MRSWLAGGLSGLGVLLAAPLDAATTSSLQVTAQIVEWWEESAAPYTYRLRLIVTGGPGLTLAHFLALDELVRRFTPTRAQLSELAAEADSAGPVLLYPALTVGNFTEIGSYLP